jgi:predicted kinase
MRWERRPYVLLAERYGCELEALFFDVPVEVCIERNKQRGREVPEQAIRNMAESMEPPAEQEGFTRIIRVPDTAQSSG